MSTRPPCTTPQPGGESESGIDSAARSAPSRREFLAAGAAGLRMFQLDSGCLIDIRAAAGVRFLDEHLSQPFDFVAQLVDLFLGDESGPEICARLRAEAPAPRVLLMSGAGGISPRAAASTSPWSSRIAGGIQARPSRS